MNINTKSLIILVILIAIGLFAIFQIYTTSNLVTRLYQHPFTVSNTLRDIQLNILNMHHHMLEMRLIQNQVDLDLPIKKINQYEQAVYEKITLIKERFLGDKQQVEELKALFMEWQPIRQELIDLIKTGEGEKARSVIEDKNRAHLIRLEKVMDYLLTFSDRKADEFLKRANKQFQLSYLWVLIVFLVVIIMARLIKKVKKAFQQSEERYQAIVENQTEWLCRFLPDTTLTFVNPAYCRYFGVEKKDILGKSFLSFIPEQAHDNILKNIQGLFNNPQQMSQTHEHPVIADGKMTWQRWTNNVILDRDGKVIEFQSVGIDITERKQIEEKLKQTTEQLSLLLEHLPIVPYTAEASGDFAATYINQSVTAITGYLPEHFTANPSFWADHIHPEDRPIVFANLKKLVEQGTQEMEYRWQIADGSYKWFSDIARLVKKSDSSYYLVGTLHDITKRKKMKIALHETKKRYSHIIDVANEGILFIDENNITTFVNKNMAKMLGYTETEMLGQPLFKFMDKQWQKQAHAHLKRRRKGISEQHDFKFQCKEGTPLWTILNTRPVFDQTGQYSGAFSMITDITERKKMEEALREQGELLRLVIDNIPQYIFWKDINCVYLGCNNSFAQFLNLNNPKEIVGKSDFDLISEVQAKSICRIEHRLMETDTAEYHVIKQSSQADGKVMWIESNKIPLHDVNGKVVGILGTTEDITERKLADEKRHEIEARLAETQKIAKLGHWEWEILTGMMTWSEEVFRHFNLPDLPSHGVSFQTFIQAVHLHDRRKVYRWIDQTLYENKAYEIEYRIVRPDKTIRYLQSFAKTIRNSTGKLSHVLGTSQDITERKQIELDLQHSQKALEQTNAQLQRFKTTLDMTLDCVFMTEAKRYQFFYANQGATNLLGYSQQALEQMTLLDILQLNHGDTQLLKESFNPSQVGLTFETLFQHNNTTLIPVEIFAQFIQLEDNSQHFLIIARDITARKKTEAQLQQAKEAAESANRAKSTFLANMSHEVRTPLNGILGYTQLLKRDETLNPQHKEAIKVIHRSGEYLLTLINDILDISKIEANRIELYETELDLNDFLKGVVDLFQMRTQEKEIDFIYHTSAQLPDIIYADEKRLRQILINLLSNAVKFTKTGSVTLEVDVIERKLNKENRGSVEEEREKGGLYKTGIRFKVRDTGIGIAKSALSKIFLPFQQVGNLKERSAGTGLGLSISKKLVNLMGGELEVESILDEGSTFCFEVDFTTLSSVVKKTRPNQSYSIRFEGPPKKILVVEDNYDNRLVLTQLLIALGFDVFEATNGQEAINKTYEYRPDLIFMDMIMPVMDGYQATCQIKKIPELKQTIIVAISASAFQSHQEQCQKAGCDDFIAKPIHTETLLNCLKKHFQTTEQDIKQDIPDSSQEASYLQKKPTVEQATILFNLTLRGDIDGIIEYVDKLEQLEPQLTVFIEQIKRLVKELKIKRIRQIVQQYMDKSG
jgi:PAS domain S-box-containing protein